MLVNGGQTFSATDSSVTAGGGGIAVWQSSSSGTGTWESWAGDTIPSGANTRTQEGHRFRNDDGSESAATWAAAQDAGVTLPTGTTVRVRVLVDASGDPASTQYQLESKLSTDATWTKVV